MEIFLKDCAVFLVGGTFCAVAQILIDRTKITPARILVLYVCLGVLLTGVGWYQKVVSFAGCGATVPIIGFGYAIANGVKEAVEKTGLLGALTGGIQATAGGIASAMLFGFLCALCFQSKSKK